MGCQKCSFSIGLGRKYAKHNYGCLFYSETTTHIAALKYANVDSFRLVTSKPCRTSLKNTFDVSFGFLTRALGQLLLLDIRILDLCLLLRLNH